MLLQTIIEEWSNGILILADNQELIYANQSAPKLLQQLNPNSVQANSVPPEIWHVCQSLIDSRNSFPYQSWLIEAEVFTESSVTFHMQVQWLQLEVLEDPYLLLIVKDSDQCLKNIVLAEAQQYGLTFREREIWLLYRSNYTYKQIAAELGITSNTVKKHLKSIHAKQKAILKRRNGDLR